MGGDSKAKQVEYLTNKWFGYREAFVLAWTNQIKYHDNRMMNRVEGYMVS